MWSLCFGIPDDTLIMSAWDIQTKSIIGRLNQTKKTNSEEISIAIKKMKTIEAFFDIETTPLLNDCGKLIYCQSLEKASLDAIENPLLSKDQSVRVLIKELCDKKCITIDENKNR